MKRQGRRWLLVVLLTAGFLFVGPDPSVSAHGAPSMGNPPGHRFARGVVLAKPKPGVDTRAVAALAGPGAQAAPLPKLGVVKLHVAAGQEQATAERLRRSGRVEYASPDYLRHVAVVPDDPDYSEQWALPRIDAPTAWTTTLGSPNVIIAVIDTGYDFSHPDRPIHLIAGPTIVSYPDPSCPPEGTAGPQDDDGHGTHVGGIVAAAFDNGVGVAGLAPGVSVLVIKAADCTGNLADSDVAQAIEYAADAGARVINMSFGGPDQDEILDQAVQYAWNKGVVLVAAAGNQSSNQPFYPASIPNVMAVSATDQNDAIAWFSNSGPDIAVAAPGVSVLSTVPSFVSSSGYAAESGTSMAAPHAAAIAGLVRSVAPELTTTQVVQAIERGAIEMGPGCPNVSYGYGRVDAAGALAAAQRLTPSDNHVAQSLPFRIYLPLVGNGGCAFP